MAGGPVVSLAASCSALAGITGSASGGLRIALDMLSDTSIGQALSSGADPEVLHRVAALATGGLDSLPHNGAVITLLSICKLSHRDSYGDIFMVAVVGPILALLICLIWLGMSGSM